MHSQARAVFGVLAVVVLGGCEKLLHREQIEAGAAAPDAGATAAATETATSTASAGESAAPSAVAAKAAPPGAVKKHDAGATAPGKAMAVPSPTTDRIARNRDKDGPCPTGFTEQPGVENHSTCARNCKTEADCHGHTCEDSDVGDGKVCSETASKPKAPKAKCKADEIDDGDACYKTCTNDTDCAKPKRCVEMRVPNPSGGTSAAMVCQTP